MLQETDLNVALADEYVYFGGRQRAIKRSQKRLRTVKSTFGET